MKKVALPVLTLIALCGPATVASAQSKPAASAGIDRAGLLMASPSLVSHIIDVDDLDSETAEAKRRPRPFGEKHSLRLNLHVGGGAEFDDSKNRLALIGGGFEYFMIDNISLNCELNGLFFDLRSDDSLAANANLLLRWHVIPHDKWSIYLDGGAGLLYGTHPVPGNGSRFNFTPQIGLGFTRELTDSGVRLMSGIRWHHVSNARLFRDNPGRDGFLIYAGLSVPF